MIRAFLGVTLSHAARELVRSCEDAFIAADGSWRGEKWVDTENLHVTLTFLGQIPEDRVALLRDPLARGAATLEPFRARIRGIHAIPRQRGATLLWLGVGEGAEGFVRLASLCSDIADAVDPVPVAPTTPRHRYTPHITLCRARNPHRVTAGAIDAIERVLHGSDERALTMSVRSFTLYRSTLTPRGPRYDALETIPLG